MAASPSTLWLGGYGSAGASGLTPLIREGGVWRAGEPYADAENVSHGVFSPRFGLHYFVDERDAGAVGVHHLTEDGWRKLARVPTLGAMPCWLALDPAEERLAVANYGDGSLSVFTLEPSTGVPLMPPAVHRENGHGPNHERQEAPHAHWVGFAGAPNRLFEVNLGADAIFAFPYGPDGLGPEEKAYSAPPGSGPRQLILRPDLPFAYLVSELDCTLSTLERRDGVFFRRSVTTTLASGAEPGSLAGFATVNRAGDRLYLANRGDDSIATFELEAPGIPRLMDHTKSGGASPRHMLLLEDDGLLLVAHEQAGGVTVLPIRERGYLGEPVARVDLPGAAFLFEATPC